MTQWESTRASHAWDPGQDPQHYPPARKHLLHHHADKQTRILRDTELLMVTSKLRSGRPSTDAADVPVYLSWLEPKPQLMILLGSVQHLKTCILLLASSSFSSRLIFINWRLLHLPVRLQNRQCAEELSLETILSILNWQNVSVNNLISHINDKSKFSPDKYQSHTHTPIPGVHIIPNS